jgi:hypothetical protein
MINLPLKWLIYKKIFELPRWAANPNILDSPLFCELQTGQNLHSLFPTFPKLSRRLANLVKRVAPGE